VATPAGASIRYSVDGTTPSGTAGTPYTGAIAVGGGTTTVIAIAYESSWTDSAVATAT
jgi:hypothetical protein